MTRVQSLDLVILVPGIDEQEAVDGLLATRQKSLGIKTIRYDFLKAINRDPGCFHEGPELLRPYQKKTLHALVILDHDGSGQEATQPDEVRDDLQNRLSTTGWGDRARVIVICPEFEIWAWSASPNVDEAFGWSGRQPGLRKWLEDKEMWPVGMSKPPHPKEAVEAALRQVRKRPSASIYRRLAETVSLDHCQGESFEALKSILRSWFSQ